MIDTIKVLTNDSFDDLLTLVKSLYKLTDPDRNSFQVINDLLVLINTKRDFTAVGLFRKNSLIGCIYGYEIAKNTFYISGLYCMKNAEGLKQLLLFLKDLLRTKSYKAYKADTGNPRVQKLLENFGAQIYSTKYYGEL